MQALRQWLSFGLTPEQEARFRQPNLPTDRRRARFIISLMLAVLLVWPFVDFPYLGWTWKFALFLTLWLAATLYSPVLLWSLKRVTRYEDYDRQVFLWESLVATVTISSAALRPVTAVTLPGSVIITLFINCFALPNRYSRQAGVSLVVAAAEFLVLARGLPNTPLVSVRLMVVLLLATPIAIFGGWHLYFYRRQAFAALEELARVNQGLEDAIAHRTADLRHAVELTNQELSERRRAEERLHETEEAVRGIGEAALDPIVMCDDRGSLTYWNRAAERVFGYTAGEAIGKEVVPLLVPERFRPALVEAIRSARSAGSDGTGGRILEMDAARAGGATFPVEVSISALHRLETWHAVAVVRDITERKRMEAELRQSQRLEAVGALAGGVAHDFNNLLTAILGASESLLAVLPETSPERQDAADISDAAGRAATLTRQLLAFSRKQVVQPKVLDLNEIVTGMNRMLRRLIGEQVELLTETEPSLWRVRADPGQVEQVIVNLVVNARDAMPRGGRVSIRTANVELEAGTPGRPSSLEPGRYVRLDVCDTGTGMAEETLAHIFEPFFTTKGVGEGTGLGLSTVYGIATQSGGGLAVRTKLGEGSAFSVYLPRVEPPPLDLAWEGEATSASSGTETLLVVEDEPLVRRQVAKVLRESGYTVLEAANGEEAVEVSAAHVGDLHLVVSDVVMPRMGGEELSLRIRGIRPAVGVLFISGYMQGADTFQDRVAKGTVLLRKPFSSGDLLQHVRQVLDRRVRA